MEQEQRDDTHVEQHGDGDVNVGEQPTPGTMERGEGAEHGGEEGGGQVEDATGTEGAQSGAPADDGGDDSGDQSE